MSRICPLDDFGFLRISGPDAVKFLHGYTTCDLTTLEESHARMGAICNLQGRMLTSFLVVREGTDLLLRMHADLIEPTIAFLKKYIVFSKAEMADMSETYRCLGVPGSAETDMLAVHREADHWIINLGNRQERWVPAAGAPESGEPREIWAALEIEAGVVWVTGETTETYIPQMLNYHQLDAIDFTKGCYLGQEIVARMQYRGELKRRLHRLHSEQQRSTTDTLLEGDVVAATGSELLAVLKNASSEPMTAHFADGEAVTATPLA